MNSKLIKIELEIKSANQNQNRLINSEIEHLRKTLESLVSVLLDSHDNNEIIVNMKLNGRDVYLRLNPDLYG